MGFLTLFLVKSLNEDRWVKCDGFDGGEKYSNPIELSYPFYGQVLTIEILPFRFNGRLFKEYEACILCRQEAGKDGYFHVVYMTVCINAIIIDNSLLYGQSFGILIHELAHAYQITLQRAKKPDIKTGDLPVVKRAVQLQRLKDLIDYEDNFERTIRILIYVSDPAEQDAFLQEYYYGQKSEYNKKYLSDLPFALYQYEYSMGKLETMVNEQPNDKTFDIFKAIGYSPKWILKYCQKGYKRLLKKYRKVYGRAKMEMDLSLERDENAKNTRG